MFLISSLIGIATSAQIIPSLLLLTTRFRIYEVRDPAELRELFRQVEGRTTRVHCGTPSGTFIGWPYAGCIDNDRGTTTATIVCTTSKITELTTPQVVPNEDGEPADPQMLIVLVETLFTSYGGYHRKRKFDIRKYVKRPEQVAAISAISGVFEKIGHAVVLLYGAPGGGKSIMCLQLAYDLRASVHRSFDPTTSGDGILALYNLVEPTKDKPLIVVIEEFDTLLAKLGHIVVSSKQTPPQIRTKTDWNKFLDDIDRGMYPYMILILTTNMTPDEIRGKYDNSYIREGRINLEYKL